MKMKTLGHSSIEVSDLCLGSMTWGTQNDADEAHDQIDRALDAGINFVDTAEMYPVNPVSAETIGRTERIIGMWFERDMRRDDVILATKHSGEGLAAVREGAPISAETIAEAVEGSLRRLKTDYIDLYQFHWPNRGSYMFRQNWDFDPSGQLMLDTIDHMEEALGALQKEVKRGTIRTFGLSNESAWGTTKWQEVARRTGGPQVASVQNEYSLLCRLFDTDMAEVSLQEDVPLLAFSPLAAGLLTGKYQDGAVPKRSRMSLNPEMGGRKTPRAFEAVAAYLDIAQRHDLDPAQMALAWCRTRPFMGSVIFGATTMDQLENCLGAAELTLSDAVMEEIAAAHRAHPMPY
ncbi:aldo/keto reductase [uncultured Roseobacter sp.]|uniref:aldo/keto reductase n=1 Tax=uncultured Roseobacter sp. TaxID=114847 RepID=UPI00260EF00C|nr:aldo/keto reductase [uncultured Roseobacter sp.]